MSIKEVLQDYALQELEEQIIMSFDGAFSKFHDYTEERSLLRVRRDIINHYVLQHQEELLPDIIAFNDALREALRTMFDKAHAVYEANSWATTIQLCILCKAKTDKIFGMLCRIQAGMCCMIVV